LRTTRDHTTSQVGAVGVADDKGRCPGGPVDEFPEHGHHVVVAVDAIGGGPPHGGQVGIAPSVAVTWPDGFPRGLDIAVIDTRAVQGDQRYTGSVLDVMNDGLPDPALPCAPLSSLVARLGAGRVAAGSPVEAERPSSVAEN